MLKKIIYINLISLVLISLIPGIALASPISKEGVIRLVNQERNRIDLNFLIQNSRLEEAAQEKAKDMIERDYWDHFFEGKSPWDWMEEAGYEYIDAGENLAIDFESLEPMHKAWMNSPAHRANIIAPQYKEIGVGIAKGEFENHQTTIVVQMFGNPQTETEKSFNSRNTTTDDDSIWEKFRVKANKTESSSEDTEANDYLGYSKNNPEKKTIDYLVRLFWQIDNYMSHLIRNKYFWLYSNLLPNYFASAKKQN